MRHLQLDDAVQIAFRRRTQVQHRLRPAVLELRLDHHVPLQQRAQHVHLMVPEPECVRIQHAIQRRGSRRQRKMRRRVRYVCDARIDVRAHRLGWERRALCLGSEHARPQRRFRRCRHAPREAREHIDGFGERQRRLAQARHERVERAVHAVALVVAIEHMLQDAQRRRALLRGLDALHLGVAVLGERACERTCSVDLAHVVHAQNAQQVAWTQRHAWHLDERHDAVLLRDERQVHLHDLDLCDRLPRHDVLAVLDEQAHELPGRRRADLCRIAFLLHAARLPVDHEPRLPDLVEPVHGVGCACESNEQATVT